MRLTHTITLVLGGAFVVPTLGMGLFGGRILNASRESAKAQAVAVTRRAEEARLAQLTVGAAGQISAQLEQLQVEIEGFRAEFEAADPSGQSPVQRAHTHDYDGKPTAGLPAYGYIDPEFGTYIDWEFKSPATMWVSRPVLRKIDEPGVRARVLRDLNRNEDVSPYLARFARYGDTIDLVWSNTLDGVGLTYPAYDIAAGFRRNPEALDVADGEQEYVKIASPEVNPKRLTRWTEPYLDHFKGGWMTSVVAPIYLDGTFRGSVGADLLLSTIRERVLGLDLGIEGFPLLLDADGHVVATTLAGVHALARSPEDERTLRDVLAAPDDDREWSPEREARLAEARLVGSPDKGWTSLGSAALAPSVGSTSVELGGSTWLVAHAPIAAPGWGLAIVVPEAAIVATTAPVAAALEAGSEALLARFTAFGGILLLLGLGGAAMLQRVTVRPLLDLGRRVSALTFERLVLDPPAAPAQAELVELEGKVNELLGLITGARDGERNEHDRLSAVLASIADAVVAIDSGGTVRLLNPGAEALLGASQAAAAGRPLSALLPMREEGSTEPFPAPGPRIAAAGGAVAFPERLVASTPSGEVGLELRGAPLRLGGVAAGAVLVFRDVSAARRLEDELIRVQKLQTVQGLASGIAHDFNNLLAGILGYVSLARIGLPGDAPSAELLARAEASIDRARGLTNQLVTFSRGGAPIRTVVDIRPMLTQATEVALAGSNCQAIYQLAETMSPADVDLGQLGQVVQNLVQNAIQAMPQGGAITLSAANAINPEGLPAGNYVVVELADTGEGVPPEHLSNVFEPFFSTRTRASGLGLAVCHSVVTRHGGRIVLESTLGAGTLVRFWLPAGVPSAPLAPVLPSEPPARPRRLLHMDDDPDLRDVTRSMLQGMGNQVESAADGAEAVAMFGAAVAAGRPYDGVLLDLTVPAGMGGLEALKQMRAISPGVVAIVCSGYGDDPVLAAPGAYGFALALRKPFTAAALHEASGRVPVTGR